MKVFFLFLLLAFISLSTFAIFLLWRITAVVQRPKKAVTKKPTKPLIDDLFFLDNLKEIKKRLKSLHEEAREEFVMWEELGHKSCVVRSDTLMLGVVVSVKIPIHGASETSISLLTRREELGKKVVQELSDRYSSIAVYVWDDDIFYHFLGEGDLTTGTHDCYRKIY